jgi:hypothetical protein
MAFLLPLWTSSASSHNHHQQQQQQHFCFQPNKKGHTNLRILAGGGSTDSVASLNKKEVDETNMMAGCAPFRVLNHRNTPT